MLAFDLIVLVDDDPINNLINNRLIRKLNPSIDIQEFMEVEKALCFLNTPSNGKNLILLDINMPVMNGWDFLLLYAKIKDKRKDKIIMLSSSIDNQDRQRAMGFSYVQGFIEKPLTGPKLEKALNSKSSE